MKSTPKIYVTISRLWHNPQISTTISSEGLSIQMDLEDFKIALKKEIPSVTGTFRQATFYKMIDDAFDSIISGIKAESAKSM